MRQIPRARTNEWADVSFRSAFYETLSTTPDIAVGDGSATFLRSTTGARVKSDLTIDYPAINAARVDYSMGCPGILIEPTASNILRSSSDMTLSSWVWSDTNGTVAQVAGAGPDGNAASRVTNPGSVSERQQLTSGVSSGDIWTVSNYWKAVDTARSYAIWVRATNDNVIINGFPLPSPYATSQTNASYGVAWGYRSLANSWIRPWQTFSVSIQNPSVKVRADTANAGHSALFCLWQLENLPFATSPIPNASTTAAAARGADKLSYPANDGNIDYRAGTLSVSFSPLFNGTEATTRFIFDCASAANANRLALYVDTDNKLHFRIWGATAAGYREIAVPVANLAFRMHNVTVAWDGSGPLSLEIDGVRCGSWAASGTWANQTAFGASMKICGDFNDANQLGGVPHLIQIWRVPKPGIGARMFAGMGR